jgi:hypothetical protein
VRPIVVDGDVPLQQVDRAIDPAFHGDASRFGTTLTPRATRGQPVPVRVLEYQCETRGRCAYLREGKLSLVPLKESIHCTRIDKLWI